MTVKERLHRVVEEMTEQEAEATLRFAATHRESGDALTRLLDAAPFDDEPETEEERAAVAEALADPAPSIPLDEVKREFGVA